MSKKQYRIAAIGFAHSHIESNIADFASCGDRVAMVAAADVAPKIAPESQEPGTRYAALQKAVKLYGFKEYCDYRKLLDENEIDIALVCAENAFHPEVSEVLLRKGIHVVVEKPMSADMPGALRMARAARETGARIVTNWPSAWSPATRKAKELVEQGTIGRLFKFTYRNSDSQGPLSYGQKITDREKGLEWWHQADTGGGALLDYCCYGAAMSCWFLNQAPIAAYGLKANFDSPYGDADDYATITVRFPQAVAILEGSWTTVNSGVDNGPVLFGTEGTLVVQNTGKLALFKTRHKIEPDEVFDCGSLPPGRKNLGLETLHHLDTGEPLFPLLDLPLNLEAMSILDTGSRSAVSKKMELIDDGTWCIG